MSAGVLLQYVIAAAVTTAEGTANLLYAPYLASYGYALPSIRTLSALFRVAHRVHRVDQRLRAPVEVLADAAREQDLVGHRCWRKRPEELEAVSATRRSSITCDVDEPMSMPTVVRTTSSGWKSSGVRWR